MSAHQSLYHYLQRLGLEAKQAEIFVQTYLYGPKPASTIASLAHSERSYTYKVLEDLVVRGLIQYNTIKGVKNYYIDSTDVLLDDVLKKEQEITQLKTEYHDIKNMFHLLLAGKAPYTPKVSQYESTEGIFKWYEDMLSSIDNQGLLVIKCYITMNFHTQVTKFSDLQKIADQFIDNLKHRSITVSGYIGSGVLITESISAISLSTIGHIAIGNQSVQLWIIGEYVYIGLFREIPFGIKLRSPDVSDLLQTMMDFMK